MAYEKKQWIDGETPLNAENLNRMEAGIEDNSVSIDEIKEKLANMKEVTYDELKSLRDGSLLVPGCQYRITDYVTTTAQENTQSAGHPFDIIVTADSADKLNENARAADKKRELLPWFEHDQSDPAERFFYVDSVVIEGLTLYRWVSYEELNQPEFGTSGQFLLTEKREVGIGDVVWGWQLLDDGSWAPDIGPGYEAPTRTIINVGEGYMPGLDYFADSKLEAWKLMYCLDNDITRFAWADEVNGKGVIYRMIDEFNNDCPYDFKNIQFKRKITDGEFDPGTYDEETWVYTFTMSDLTVGEVVDFSLKKNTEYVNDDGEYKQCVNNSIKEALLDYQPDGAIRIKLNDNVFLNIFDDRNSYLYNDCHSNTLGSNCYGNTFGNDCHSNTLGSNCWDNTFGASCKYNTFGNYCYMNTFDGYCSSNTLGESCSLNTFGNSCYDNTFDISCSYNTFGNSCGFNNFGNDCRYNTLGMACRSNTFGASCYYNTFGEDCGSNTFGMACRNNAFVKSCWYNTFSVGCTFLQISDASATYKKYIYVENGTQAISDANKFDLYDLAILSKNYQVTFKRTPSGKYLMLWATDTGTMTGKIKENYFDTTWEDIV